ncbi:hypothetical protein LCGC14_0944300 [marine sediment metagenome]|uniref:Uncharacterized protein n=1 Tax=marine sediment metagenome TaxID=412755 RepID=A0A0F9RQH7_9ZZZZ
MTQKNLGIENIKQATDEIPDLKVFGDGDTWALLCKASSEKQGWMKSTKVMNVPGGCVVQVTTQQRSGGVVRSVTYAIAEAVTFVPGVQIITEQDGTSHFIKFLL